MNAISDSTALELIAALERNTNAQLEFIQAMNRSQSEWLSPEDTAQMLGIPLTKSRSHRVRVANLVRRGLLNKVRVGRPPYYWKEEVQQLSMKIRDGKAVV